MAFENVVKVNYNNHTYELNGVSVDTFLESVQFNRATSDLVVDGDTLRIQPKTGTKGCDDELEDLDLDEVEVDPVEEFLSTLTQVEEPEKERYDYVDGQFIYLHPAFTTDELVALKNAGREVVPRISLEQIVAHKDYLNEIKVSVLAELLGKSAAETVKIVNELRTVL